MWATDAPLGSRRSGSYSSAPSEARSESWKALLDAIARLKAAKEEPLACRRIAEIEGYLDQLESRVKAEYIRS